MSISSEIFLNGLPQLLSPDENFQWFFFQMKDKFFLIFGLQQKNGFLVGFFSAGLSKLQSTCPHELFNELCFMDFSYFYVIEQKCSTMRRVVRESYWSCIPKTRGNIWGENCNFLKLGFFCRCWDFSKKFWVCCLKVLAGLTKLQLTCLK